LEKLEDLGKSGNSVWRLKKDEKIQGILAISLLKNQKISLMKITMVEILKTKLIVIQPG